MQFESPLIYWIWHRLVRFFCRKFNENRLKSIKFQRSTSNFAMTLIDLDMENFFKKIQNSVNNRTTQPDIAWGVYWFNYGVAQFSHQKRPNSYRNNSINSSGWDFLLTKISGNFEWMTTSNIKPFVKFEYLYLDQPSTHTHTPGYVDYYSTCFE